MSYRPPMSNGVVTPQFAITIDGRVLGQDLLQLVEEITFESHESGSDMGTIYFRDPRMTLINNNRILRGQRVIIRGGWRGDMALWLSGHVSMVDIEFPETGDPNIIVHCMDDSYLLDRTEVKTSYSRMTFNQVAAIVAQRHGLRTSGAATEKVHENISQANETDMKFLLRLAEAEGLELKVKNGTITWRLKDRVRSMVETYTWRDVPFSLRSFAPRVALADRKDVVDEEDIDTETGETDSGTATGGTRRNTLGTKTTVGMMVRDSHKGVWRRVDEE